METMTIGEAGIEAAAVRAAQALSEGAIVLYPTDTLYGLAVDAGNPDALSRLYDVKGREEGKPVSVVVPDIAGIDDLAIMSSEARSYAERFLPGALTLVLPARENVSSVLAPNRKIGVRIPDDPFCLALAHAFKKPFTATSANRSGKETLGTLDAIRTQFGTDAAAIALWVDGGSRSGGSGSTVLDLTTPTPHLLREGVLSRAVLGLPLSPKPLDPT